MITNNKCDIIIQDEYDSQFAYVYILQLNKVNGVTSQHIVKTTNENVVFESMEDGFYSLMTIKIPFDSEEAYHYNDGIFYKNADEIDLQEIIDTNPEILDISMNYYFHICSLKHCFIEICYKIFNSQTNQCFGSLDKDLIYRRDLVWSVINSIKYMIEFDRYEEAEQLLEKITDCNGLCSKSNDCGC